MKIAYALCALLSVPTLLWCTDLGTSVIQANAEEETAKLAGELTPFKGKVFFSATHPEYGTEPWVSDGTQEGTKLLKDLVPGPKSSLPTEMVAVGDWLYFATGKEETTGGSLWKTDGTTEGTSLVASFGFYRPAGLMEFRSQLYFAGTSREHGQELWKSDGTREGTVLVKDIWPGEGGSAPMPSVRVGDVLFLTARTADAGRELWRSDGTEAGTTLVKDILPGEKGSLDVSDLVAMANKVYFRARTGPHCELFVSDGSAERTMAVTTSSREMPTWDPRDLVVLKNKLIFTSDAGRAGYPLWASDGTAKGTIKLLDHIRVWLTDQRPAVTLGDKACFVAGDALYGKEVWITDGTKAGTVLLKDLNEGPSDSEPEQLAAVEGQVYFTAIDGKKHRVLWKSDGSPAGTRIVKEFAEHVKMGGFKFVNGTVFFWLHEGNKLRLYKTDGTSEGTREIPLFPRGHK